MNQISPRIFEAIENKTLLVLIEGKYSNILIPKRNFFPLKRDLSNWNQLRTLLMDDDEIQKIVDRTFQEIILSKKYSYNDYVKNIENLIFKTKSKNKYLPKSNWLNLRLTSKYPSNKFFLFYLVKLWMRVPKKLRKKILKS